MTEQTGATGTQADPGTQPPAGDSEAQAADETGEKPSQPETISNEEARKLRQESSSLRRRLRELEERAKADEDAKLSETDRLTKRVGELESTLKERETAYTERALRLSTTVAAAKLGFVDPEDALHLIDRAAIEFDEDGMPTNLDPQLRDLAKAKPYLVAPRSAGSFDTGVGAGRGSAPRSYTREQIKDPTFYSQNRDDIMAAMREGRVRD